MEKQVTLGFTGVLSVDIPSGMPTEFEAKLLELLALHTVYAAADEKPQDLDPKALGGLGATPLEVKNVLGSCRIGDLNGSWHVVPQEAAVNQVPRYYLEFRWYDSQHKTWQDWEEITGWKLENKYGSTPEDWKAACETWIEVGGTYEYRIGTREDKIVWETSYLTRDPENEK
jgi:hypothetical protein